MRFIILFIYLTCFSSVVFSQNKKLAVIGSSTAKGYGLANPETESWVNRVRNYYVAQGVIASPAHVVNLAQSGTNCVTGMPDGYVSPYTATGFQYPDTVRNITAAINLVPKPDVIIVSYPTNGYDWMPFNDIINDLTVIKNTAEAAGIRCYIASTQPRNTFSSVEKQKLRNLKDTIMKRFGEFAIDFYTVLAAADNTILPQYNMDGVHPNAAGHEELFKLVLAKNIFPANSPPPPPQPPAPVFSEVKAIKLNKKNVLHWTVSNQPQSGSFTIERSRNGSNYEIIGTVNSNGSIAIASYDFTDDKPYSGSNYYKIHLSDNNILKASSPILRVYSSKKSFVVNGMRIIQVKDKVQVEINAEASSRMEVSILDYNGIAKKRSSFQIQKGSNTLAFSLSSIPRGIYFLRFSNGMEYETVRAFRQ